MNKYVELMDKRSKIFNEFPMFFAFSNEQLEKGRQKLGVTEYTDLLSIGNGGFIRKTDRDKFHNMLDKLNNELKEKLKNDKFLEQAMHYELVNHEYIISYDCSEVLEFFSDFIDINSNRVKIALNKAIKDITNSLNYKQEVE